MKKYLLLFLSAFALPAAVIADIPVKGYYRSNGTYVQPYRRTRPNSTKLDNYSYPGNSNPNKYQPLQPYRSTPLKPYRGY